MKLFKIVYVLSITFNQVDGKLNFTSSKLVTPPNLNNKVIHLNETLNNEVHNQKNIIYSRFLGWPHALTSDTAHKILEGLEPSKLPITTLNLQSSQDNMVVGTQILYEKLYKGNDAPLVSVLLMDDSQPLAQQLILTLFPDKFDMIAQKCSCYWVDGKEISFKTKLQSSKKFYLRFVDTLNLNPKFDARSGYFSIISNHKK